MPETPENDKQGRGLGYVWKKIKGLGGWARPWTKFEGLAYVFLVALVCFLSYLGVCFYPKESFQYNIIYLVLYCSCPISFLAFIRIFSSKPKDKAPKNPKGKILKDNSKSENVTEFEKDKKALMFMSMIAILSFTFVFPFWTPGGLPLGTTKNIPTGVFVEPSSSINIHSYSFYVDISDQGQAVCTIRCIVSVRSPTLGHIKALVPTNAYSIEVKDETNNQLLTFKKTNNDEYTVIKGKLETSMSFEDTRIFSITYVQPGFSVEYSSFYNEYLIHIDVRYTNNLKGGFTLAVKLPTRFGPYMREPRDISWESYDPESLIVTWDLPNIGNYTDFELHYGPALNIMYTPIAILFIVGVWAVLSYLPWSVSGSEPIPQKPNNHSGNLHRRWSILLTVYFGAIIAILTSLLGTILILSWAIRHIIGFYVLLMTAVMIIQSYTIRYQIKGIKETKTGGE